QPRPSRGVASRTEPGAIELTTTRARPIGVALHVVALNQALHALWRGGYFQAAIAGLPGGAEVQLDTLLPPVAPLSGDRVELRIGGIRVTASVASVNINGFEVRAGLAASVGIQYDNSDRDLKFNDVQIEGVWISTGNQTLGSMARTKLEEAIEDA